MTDALSDGTYPAAMDGARSLGRRILEHFVAPAAPVAGEVTAPDAETPTGSDDEARATDSVPTPSATPAEAWPTPWTAAGISEATNPRVAVGAPGSTTRRPATEAPQPTDPRAAAGWLPPIPLELPLPSAPVPAGPSSTARAGTVPGRTSSPSSEPIHPAGSVAHPPTRPRRAAVPRRAATASGPQRVVVLGVPDDVGPAAAAVANEVRGPRGVVLAAWSPQANGDFGEALATFGARRLAAAVTAEGHPATPRGRVAWAELPSDPGPAAAAYERLAASVPTPVVLAVAGPRPDAFEPLLHGADLVVVTIRPTDRLLADLARGSLAGVTAPVVTVAPPVGSGRLIARAGFGRLPPIRDAVRPQVPA